MKILCKYSSGKSFELKNLFFYIILDLSRVVANMMTTESLYGR
jgi:hypothetical protein